MDICDFNYYNLMSVLPLRLSRGKGSKETQLSLLRSYVNWCIENSIKQNNENPIQNIRVSDVDSSALIRRQFIKNPDHLQEVLDNVLESALENTSNGIMYRMVCWLLYEGLTEEETMGLTKNDVDFSNSSVKTPDGSKTIIISDRLKDLIVRAIELEFAERPNNHGGVSQLPLEKSDKLFRKIYRKDSTNSAAYLRAKLSELKKEFVRNTYENTSLAPKRLWLSGMFYRLHQMEIMGVSLTDDNFRFCVNEDMLEDSIKMKVLYNKRDYQNWKKAYHL